MTKKERRAIMNTVEKAKRMLFLEQSVQAFRFNTGFLAGVCKLAQQLGISQGELHDVWAEIHCS